MNGIYLLLGTNLGNREANLFRAQELLTGHGIIIKRISSVYETAAWGIEEQPAFLNQVIEVDTTHIPQILLRTILHIEEDMGRVRDQKWAERLIDIDILYFKDQVIESEELIVPHPEIPNRRFTLLPLAEIAENEMHPGLQQTQLQLLERCPDSLKVEKYLSEA